MSRPRCLAVLLLCLVSVTGCDPSSSDPPTEGARSPAAVERRAERDLRGAPAPLAALHEQGSQLLDGGVPAFRKRLAKLNGYPVVVNKWGSWCGPCRAEFPYFQEQAIKAGKRVAFLGVDGQDPGDGARSFLDDYPVPFPSYKDFELKIASEIKAVGVFPSTVFYDKRGAVTYLKQGPYRSESELAADIGRYAR